MADPRIKFDIAANATGQASVEELASALLKLEGTLDGDAAAQAGRLGRELQSIAQTGAAVDGVRRLQTEIDETERTLREATTQFDTLRYTVAELGVPTRAQAEQMQRLSAEIARSKSALEGQKASLDRNRSALAAAGLSAEDLGQAQRRVRDQIAATVPQAQALARDYGVVGTAATAAAARQTQAQRGVREGIASISTQLQGLQRLVGVALGGSVVGGLARDVSATADAYSDLGARIRLVTGEGAAFDEAFEGVFDIATRTNSAVEETGTLFARIAQAGEEIGLSQRDALALTETINQSIQVGGASAGASQAAIQQLIQGLQSGVLRGEEFNSVMEQAPRLAKALADGLGVTTGELRKQAEAGKLTADVVIRALQGQATVVQEEFGKLPPTVGRALQNLSTEWTRYVGEVDKANGISVTAAEAIGALSRNLDTLGTLLFSAGKAAAAYQALRLAQTFLGIGEAARASAAAKGVETASTTANTTATVVNTQATTANTVAKQQNAAAASGVAAANAAATAGAAAGAGAASRFAAAISGMKTFGLIAVLTNLQEIGTAIGEGIAKLQGYGRVLEENEIRQRADAQAAREAAQARAELAQRTQQASDQSLGLTAASKALVAEFEGLATKGTTAAESIDKLAKSLDLGNLQGIADAGAALDALALKGKLSADQVRQAFAQALNGQDLAVFEATARAAFDGSEQGARRLAAALDGALGEALRRSGADLRELQTGVSEAATRAINDFDLLVSRIDTLGERGINAGKALSASLDKALEAAKTEKAVQQVIDRWEDLGRTGTVTGKQLADGLETARKKLDDVAQGVGSLDEALRVFGLKSRAELQRTADATREAWQRIRSDTALSLTERQQAFEQYAEAAVAANKGVIDSQLQAEAAAVKLRVAVDESGKVTVQSMGRATTATQGMRQAVGEVADRFAALGRASASWGATAIAEYERVMGAVDRLVATQRELDASLGATRSGAAGIDGAASTLRRNAGVGSVLDFSGEPGGGSARTDADGFVLGPDGGRLTIVAPAQRRIPIASPWVDLQRGFQGGRSNNGLPSYISGFNDPFVPMNPALAIPRRRTEPQPRTETPSRTVDINLNINGRRISVQGSPDEADALVAALEQAQRAAGLN